MSSPNTEFPRTSHLTEAPSLCSHSSRHSVRHLTWSNTSPLATTLKAMARLSVLIKLSSSTSGFTVTINTVTGPTYFRLRNLPTTMPQMRPLVFHHSLPTCATIRTFPSTPNTTLSLPAEEFTLGIDSKSLHAMVLMQTVYHAVVWHSGGFLKHVVISVTDREE